MITQYSRVQLTLSEKEKEYAWFSYTAKIIRAGCNDQQMSGYTVTGTGIDGQEIKAELTNEELFQLFSEITMKYGRKLVTQEMEQHFMPITDMQNFVWKEKLISVQFLCRKWSLKIIRRLIRQMISIWNYYIIQIIT